MDLAELIRANLDALVADWTRFAGDRIQAAEALSREELQDSARIIFRSIADDMDTAQTAGAQWEKATGRRPDNCHPITEHATRHAMERASQGFSLPDLLSEFRAARASVMRLIGRADGGAVVRVEEVGRFNEAVDEALAVSAECFDRKLDQARGMFLGVLGHDMRNPLGAIQLGADALLRDEGLPPQSVKAAATIYSSGKRIEYMMNDLLDFTCTRLGRGLAVQFATGNLGETVGQVVDELRLRHPAARIDYETCGELYGRWDFGRLAQIVSNLGGNAIQHGDIGHPIAIRLDGRDDEVVLTVRNEGPPIGRDAIGRIFEPMTRGAAGSRTMARGSLGLGLYICKQIALAHDGSIAVSSDERGTAFVVRIARRVREDRKDRGA